MLESPAQRHDNANVEAGERGTEGLAQPSDSLGKSRTQDRALDGIEFPPPGRLANTILYDVTRAAGEFRWPTAAPIAVSVPAWYRSVSWLSETDPRERAHAERQRLRTVLAWAALVLSRTAHDIGATRTQFTVHCRDHLRGAPVLCRLTVRIERDAAGAPVIAILTSDGD